MSVKVSDQDGGLNALVFRCAAAILDGHKTVTISATGKPPAGFPRGELLSVGTNGSKNYALCPIKVLAWVHKKAIKTISNAT